MITVLFYNFALYIILSFYYSHRGVLSLPFVLSAYYAVVAFLGIFIIGTGIYEVVIPYNHREDFSVLPFIFCFICVAVLIKPFERVHYHNIAFSQIPYNKTVNFFINIWIGLTIAFMLLKLSQAVQANRQGFGDMYEITAVDGDSVSYFYGKNKFLLAFNNFSTNLMVSFSPFVMCYALYGIITHKIRRIKAYCMLLLILLTKCFSALALGSRGNLFFAIWSFFFFIIIFYKHLSSHVRGIIKKAGLFTLSIVLLYSVLITLSRAMVSGNVEGIGGIARYFGEPFPNLTNIFWNKVVNHPYGLRFFPFVLGSIYDAESVQDGYAFWRQYTGVPVLLFKTIFGDLYIEYGTIPAIVIVLSISTFFYLFFSHGKISFWKISIIFWYFDLVLQGIFGFNKVGYTAFIQLIAIVIISLVIKFYIDYLSRKKYIKQGKRSKRLYRKREQKEKTINNSSER